MSSNKKKAKGIGLLSGGLDSILAVKVLQEQDLELVVVTFTTPFFGPRAGVEASEVLGIPVRLIDISQKHLDMLRNPRYGYGSHMNPCIDCHALMLREAGRLMVEERADFLFTGEVVGQRPMSQRRDSLRSVEKLSGRIGRVLRPLSARLLPPTIPEMEGMVDRDRLLDIQGRSRKRQVELAARYGIKDYPQPGGGCMLTKEGFGKKLRALFAHYPGAGLREVETLKWGRHVLLPRGTICAIGRNEADNRMLEKTAGEHDILLRTPHYPGPTALMIAREEWEDDLPLASKILLAYSDAPISQGAEVAWIRGAASGTVFEKKQDREQFRAFLLGA